MAAGAGFRCKWRPRGLGRGGSVLLSGVSMLMCHLARAGPRSPQMQRAMMMSARTGALPQQLLDVAQAVREAESGKEKNMQLVRLGSGSWRCFDSPPANAVRVPGCISVVHVLAAVGEDGRVQLRGSSDAALARGMLALVIDGLDGLPVGDVLDLESSDVRCAAVLDGIITSSRINGLDNILRTVQDQLRKSQIQEAPSPGTRSLASDTALPVGVPAHGYWAEGASAEKVAVLLSGGVDSSVALHLLKAQGYDVHAFYLRVWLADELADLSDCPWEEDWAYASAVCERMGVPLDAVSVQDAYWDRVVQYLVDEAKVGRTPNPDVMCNSRIKFGVFLDSVGAGFSKIASGHYAQVCGGDGGVRLLRGVDVHKDQSYFLSSLTQGQLRRLEFPIGGFRKPEVRKLAEELDLATCYRKDSQGVCFLGRLQFDEFIRHHLGERPGQIVEWETGKRVGTHRGIWFHTVGQRRGLGPGLTNEYAAKGPWHVVAKDVDEDIVFVSREYWRIADKRREMNVASLNWIGGLAPAPPNTPWRTQVQVRHGGGAHPATVHIAPEGSSARVELDAPDKGLAPGQFAAFYDGDVCLGAGVIS